MPQPDEAEPPERVPALTPLPPVEQLERLEALAPGSTQRLLKLLEAQQRHRHEYENSALDQFHTLQRRAQAYSFAFAICGLLATCFLGWVGQSAAAVAVGGGTIVGVVAAYLGRKRSSGSGRDVTPPKAPPA